MNEKFVKLKINKIISSLNDTKFKWRREVQTCNQSVGTTGGIQSDNDVWACRHGYISPWSSIEYHLYDFHLEILSSIDGLVVVANVGWVSSCQREAFKSGIPLRLDLWLLIQR